jgi:hypothetical protein
MNAALPLLWLVAFGLASGYDARSIGGRIPHDPERRGELAAAIAISSREINIQLSRDCLLVALPSTTLFDLLQLWNVLLGEISLVGLCPALPDAMEEAFGRGSEIDERLLANERDQVVRDAMSSLPKRWQRLLEMLMADPPIFLCGDIGPARAACRQHRPHSRRCVARLRVLLQAP